MKVLLLGLLLSVVPAFAKENPHPVYQDGVLEGAQHQQSRNACPEGPPVPIKTGADNHSGGSAAADGASAEPKSCDDTDDTFDTTYRVKSGGAFYILTPLGDVNEADAGLLRRSLIPHNVLDRQLPQTPIKLRSDGRHFFVKIGNRESEYSVARYE